MERKIPKARLKGKRGGWRPNSGRRPGVPNQKKVTLERYMGKVMDAKMKECADKGIPFDGYYCIQALYLDPNVPAMVRKEAAKLAVRYERPALSTTEVSGPGGGPIEHNVTEIREGLRSKLLKVITKPKP